MENKDKVYCVKDDCIYPGKLIKNSNYYIPHGMELVEITQKEIAKTYTSLELAQFHVFIEQQIKNSSAESVKEYANKTNKLIYALILFYILVLIVLII